MATLLDVGLLEHFSVLFTFILVLMVTYGILELTKILGENKGLHAIVAFCLAVFMAFSSGPQSVIQTMIPWVMLVIVFFLFVIIAMRFVFGNEAGDQMLLTTLGGDKSAGVWIFVILIGILIAALGSVVGPGVTPGVENSTIRDAPTTDGDGDREPGEPLSTDTNEWRSNVLNTIYHPKILGTILLLLIAVFTIKLITQTPV